MALARPRPARSTANAQSADFSPEMGTPIVRLWILRLLSRGRTKIVRRIGDLTALVVHLGIPVQDDPGSDDPHDEPLAPGLTPALVRRLLRSLWPATSLPCSKSWG